MKIAIVGLGAIGGLLAARLAAAGHTVSALARGEQAADGAQADDRNLHREVSME